MDWTSKRFKMRFKKLLFIVLSLVTLSAFADDDEKEVWQKLNDNMSVQTNALFFTKSADSYTGFRTNIVTNLPESGIVGAPQSSELWVEGNCDNRTFHVIQNMLYSEKWRGGYPVHNFQNENFIRKVQKGSSFEKAFDFMCKIARTKK
jgi:hypothetical protein